MTRYWLHVGTTAGGYDLFSQDEGTSLNQTVTSLPTRGSKVYVRLWSVIGGAWLFNDYTYTAASIGLLPPVDIGPGRAKFCWTSGTGVTRYWLHVGTTPGGYDLFSQDEGTSLCQTVTGLPTDGSPVYVRLWSVIGGAWLFNDYVYSPARTRAGDDASTGVDVTGINGVVPVTLDRGDAACWLQVGTWPGGGTTSSAKTKARV